LVGGLTGRTYPRALQQSCSPAIAGILPALRSGPKPDQPLPACRGGRLRSRSGRSRVGRGGGAKRRRGHPLNVDRPTRLLRRAREPLPVGVREAAHARGV
jgi:hypothetical protein